MATIEINPQFQMALDVIETTSDCLFLTGKAGTGKSTLLTLCRSQSQKFMVVLAPTGVAALNVRGETIHSFFKFKPNITVEAAIKNAQSRKNTTLFKQIDALIIDEISMVRADLLDCIDAFLKTVLKSDKPFGGKQMIFIGDLYQLSPVVTYSEQSYFQEVYKSPYFFSSHVFKDPTLKMNFIELEKIYRQNDDAFIDILNAVRNRTPTDDHLALLNRRVVPAQSFPHKQAIYLTSTNADADAINTQRLNQLAAPSATFTATIGGNFDEKVVPTEKTLLLKVGAQIMFLNNDAQGQWVNGTLGDIKAISLAEKTVQVQIQDGPVVTVKPHKWDLYKYVYDAKAKTLSQESSGSFTQFPLKLAWAITIHKSQGKTFDRVLIDLGRGAFASGQVYVALSRCRTLEGIELRKPLYKSQIMMDSRVVHFLTQYQYKQAELGLSAEEKIKQIQAAIDANTTIKITYLKRNDEKSTRTIIPKFVGKADYNGKNYLSLQGYCLTRKENRTFRVDRILELTAIYA